MAALLVLGWLAWGVLSYGLFLAFLQRQFPYIAYETRWMDVAFSALNIPLGPIGLFATTAAILLHGGSFKHGLMWWPESTPDDRGRW